MPSDLAGGCGLATFIVTGTLMGWTCWSLGWIAWSAAVGMSATFMGGLAVTLMDRIEKQLDD